MEKVSVILVNYNSSEDSIHCIKSLINQNYPYISVILVDNSESEEYINEIHEKLKDFHSNVSKISEEDFKELNFNKDIILIKASENKGFSGGNNIGIKLARENKADFIWILNNDTEVEKNTIEEMLKTSSKYNAQLVICKINNFYDRDKVQYYGETVSYQGEYSDFEDKIKKPSLISGCNLFLKSSVFEKTGLLDEDYFLYFEDNDFYHKIIKNDIPYIYTPHTKIYHKGGSSIGKYMATPLSAYYGTRNAFLILKKLDLYEYQDVLKQTLINFLKNQKKKEIIKAILLGVYDFIQGKIGRQDKLDYYLNLKLDKSRIDINNRDLEQIYKKHFTNINLNELLAEKYKNKPERAIEYIFMLALLNPRKKEYYEAFFKTIEKIFESSEEKENGKSISMHN